MSEYEPSVSVNPDRLFMLSATEDDVILLGLYFGDDAQDCEDCVLYITRELFRNALEEWLDRKAEYREMWNSWCGVGSIVFEELSENPKPSYLARCLVDDTRDYDVEDTRWGEMVEVRTFRASTFIVDMEHG